jgi:hypothetical protein
MEQKQPPNVPQRFVRPKSNAQFVVSPRGMLFFLIALLVLMFGGIGYLEYDRLVKPYLSIFVCCIPAIILAAVLIFFGFATKFTTIRKVHIQKPAQLPREQIIDMTKPGRDFDGRGRMAGDGLKKFEPTQLSPDEIKAQMKNLNQFLNDLDEQHKDGLIMDNVYLNLKNKYQHELTVLNQNIARNTVKAKRIKKIKPKSE